MANQTFLVTTSAPAKPVAGEEGIRVLCAASYMIPVFWYMLFDEASVIVVKSDDERDEEDDDPEYPQPEYPYLSKRGNQAIALAERRWTSLRKVVGADYDSLFSTWLGYIKERTDAYLQCEIAEWFEMFDDRLLFEQHLAKCLHAVADTEGDKDAEVWQELFGQANAWDGAKFDPAGTFSLCGYALA